MVDFIYDIEEWYRTSRGREVQFFAMDEEIQEWLLEGLSQEYAPYSLVGADLLKKPNDDHYYEYGFEYDIRQFLENLNDKIGGRRINFWIRSKILTPSLKLTDKERIEARLSMNGLVLLQPGSYTKEKEQRFSRIAIVNKIENINTHETVEHEGYQKLFRALAKVIKKKLYYTTMARFKDGREAEIKNLLMTQKAFDAYQQGHKFTQRPFTKIK